MNPTQSASQPAPEPYDHIQAMIPTKNMPSLLSYYFGVFGLVPIIGLPLTIAAIILGFVGLKQYKKNPTPGAKGHAITGIVLGCVQLAVFIVFIILMARWASSDFLPPVNGQIQDVPQ